MENTTETKPATDKQVGFILSLVSERPNWDEHLNGNDYERVFDLATGSGKFVGRIEASHAITALLAMPKAPRPVQAPKPAQAPTAAPAATTDTIASITPGWRYAVETGEDGIALGSQPIRFFRASKLRRNGNCYIDQEFGGGERTDAAVLYANGSVRIIDQRVAGYLRTIASDPQAAALLFGKETGRCGHCGIELTDWISRALWIGPVCDPRPRKVRMAEALATGATPDEEA
jgi:hypothetical protein